MFETIGTLFTIVIWAIAIFLFLGGIFICIGNLKDGTGGEKALAVIAIILGVIAFVCMYAWFESIVWCMAASGLVLCMVGNAFSDEGRKTSSAPGPKSNLAGEIIDEVIKYERDVAVVEEGIRRSKK